MGEAVKIRMNKVNQVRKNGGKAVLEKRRQTEIGTRITEERDRMKRDREKVSEWEKWREEEGVRSKTRKSKTMKKNEREKERDIKR